MSIFETLEADSQQLNNTWLTTDFKDYFKNYPSPDKYKQAWLIKRVLELEGTTAGKTISRKENEIFGLKQTISGLNQQINGLDEEKKKKDTLIIEIENKAQSEREFWIKRASEQIQATRDFYLNGINSVLKFDGLIAENATLKNENNKLIADKQTWENDKKGLEQLKQENKKINSQVLGLQHVNRKFREEADDNYILYFDALNDLGDIELKYSELVNRTDKELAESKAKHKKAIEEFEKKHKKAVSELTNRGITDKEKFLKELGELEEKRINDLAKLEQEHRDYEDEMNKKIDKSEEQHKAEIKELNERVATANKKNFDLIHKPVATQETQTDISADDLLIAHEAFKGISITVNQKNFLGGLDEKKRLIIVAKLWDIKKNLPSWLEDVRLEDAEDKPLNIDEKKWYIERMAEKDKEIKDWQNAYGDVVKFYGYPQPSDLSEIKNNKKEIKSILERVRVQFNLLKNFTKTWNEWTIADIKNVSEMVENMGKSVLFTGDIKTTTNRERERERERESKPTTNKWW